MRRRAVGYGRFSNAELQNSSSTVDQGRNIEVYAEDRKLELVANHADDGFSGATLKRPGLQTVLGMVQRGAVEIVVVEDIDRLGRDEEHLQYLKKVFKLHDVEVHTLVGGGKIDDLMFSFKGIISEQARGKIAYQTRRALVGAARGGRSTGGRILGYSTCTKVNAVGETETRKVVDPIEAAVVLDIFQRYATGSTLNAICKHLQATGVPTTASRSKRVTANRWNPSTLSGNIERGEGILNNRRYIGVIVFNQRNYREVPDGEGGFNRRPRSNPAKIIETASDETQRIVPQELWDAVKAKQLGARAARDAKFKLDGNGLSAAKPPAHLLSGLVHCGGCGGPYVSVGGDRWRCRDRSSNGCTNASITGAMLSSRVLGGLRGKLLRPDLVARFAEKLQQELKAAQAGSGARRAEIEHRLIVNRDSNAKLVALLETESSVLRSVIARLSALEIEEDELVTVLAGMKDPPVVRLPVNYERIYVTAIAELERHLASEEAPFARKAIRKLIERVVVKPGNARGGKARGLELHGDLFRMLDFLEAIGGRDGAAARQNEKFPRHVSGEGIGTSVVAGTGFEPVTFRL